MEPIVFIFAAFFQFLRRKGRESRPAISRYWTASPEITGNCAICYTMRVQPGFWGMHGKGLLRERQTQKSLQGGLSIFFIHEKEEKKAAV